MINVILTSYNRPIFLGKALNSLLAQTSPDWQCWLMDDGSDAATRGVIGQYAYEPRITTIFHDTSGFERMTTTRYSVLINSVLPLINEGIVSYLCDNVEYHPALVETVLKFFNDNPDVHSAYVPHDRDAYTESGERIGRADALGHWNRTPPRTETITIPQSNLDHSQVFHRLPVDIRWSEDIRHKYCGDGEFFTRLVKAYGPIEPIGERALTTEHLFR